MGVILERVPKKQLMAVYKVRVLVCVCVCMGGCTCLLLRACLQEDFKLGGLQGV